MHDPVRVLGFLPALLAGALVCGCSPAGAGGKEVPSMQAYDRPGELAPLPAGTASLYKTPWRANVRTASAYEALDGVGVYYKHIPGGWTVQQNAHVMKQMKAAGVRRLRLALCHGMYITKDWAAPGAGEMKELRTMLRACKAAGIRPTATFVHIPPVGEGDQLQKWWKASWNTALLPVGPVGSKNFTAYLDKTYEALLFVLKEARAAGFAKRGSYDLEMGQNLWWGAPARPKPWPGTDLSDLLPGGRIYAFDKALIDRLRRDGYDEPTVWWSQCHHVFESCTDREVPPGAVGRAISFYSAAGGTADGSYLNKTNTWPVRKPMRYLEGDPPEVLLARPEGIGADRSRRDCLIELLTASKTPTAVVALGTVPSTIPNAKAGGLDGWEIKSRGLTRSLAFWLNQGAAYVLLHSAYEGKNDETSHALIPFLPDPMKFRWQQSKPLATLHAFVEPLRAARPLKTLDKLRFRFAVAPDVELIPATGKAGPLTAADAVALLPFQLSAKRFAVAAYVLTPNIAVPMKPATMTLEVDRKVAGGVETLHPSSGAKGKAEVLTRQAGATTIRFAIRDDVTWLVFNIP